MKQFTTLIFLSISFLSYSEKGNERYSISAIVNCLAYTNQIKSAYIKCHNDYLVFSTSDFLRVYKRDVGELEKIDDKYKTPLGDVGFFSDEMLEFAKPSCYYSLTGIISKSNKLQLVILKWSEDSATKFSLQFKYVDDEWKFVVCELIRCPEGGREDRLKIE